MKRIFFILSIILTPGIFADTEDDYFKALDALQQLPAGAAAIKPCDVVEKKFILNLLKRGPYSADFANINLTSTGMFEDQFNESFELYKGDFSNEGYVEYMFVSTGGSAGVNTVADVFKRKDQQLVRIDFKSVVIRNLKLGDMAGFYFYVAKPFAIIVKDNKTYLRFMSFPGTYDKNLLQLCTYYWHGDKFDLIGPPYCIGGKLYKNV